MDDTGKKRLRVALLGRERDMVEGIKAMKGIGDTATVLRIALYEYALRSGAAVEFSKDLRLIRSTRGARARGHGPTKSSVLLSEKEQRLVDTVKGSRGFTDTATVLRAALYEYAHRSGVVAPTQGADK